MKTWYGLPDIFVSLWTESETLRIFVSLCIVVGIVHMMTISIYSCYTQFNKRITVINKSVKIKKDGWFTYEILYVMDEGNEIYKVDDSFWHGTNSRKIWNSMEEKNTYDVECYGIRWFYYPNIISAKKVQ